MARGEHARLRIGFVSLADYGVLPGLLKAYKAAHPGVRLALREMLSPEQAAALAAGELDFGLLLPPVGGAARLEHIVVQRERFVVGAAGQAPAGRARRARLALRELAGEPFVMIPRADRAAPVRYRRAAGRTGRDFPQRRAGGDPDADRGEPGLERARRRDRARLGGEPRPPRRGLSRARRAPSEPRSMARVAARRARRAGRDFVALARRVALCRCSSTPTSTRSRSRSARSPCAGTASCTSSASPPRGGSGLRRIAKGHAPVTRRAVRRPPVPHRARRHPRRPPGLRAFL